MDTDDEGDLHLLDDEEEVTEAKGNIRRESNSLRITRSNVKSEQGKQSVTSFERKGSVSSALLFPSSEQHQIQPAARSSNESRSTRKPSLEPIQIGDVVVCVPKSEAQTFQGPDDPSLLRKGLQIENVMMNENDDNNTKPWRVSVRNTPPTGSTPLEQRRAYNKAHGYTGKIIAMRYKPPSPVIIENMTSLDPPRPTLSATLSRSSTTDMEENRDPKNIINGDRRTDKSGSSGGKGNNRNGKPPLYNRRRPSKPPTAELKEIDEVMGKGPVVKKKEKDFAHNEVGGERSSSSTFGYGIDATDGGTDAELLNKSSTNSGNFSDDHLPSREREESESGERRRKKAERRAEERRLIKKLTSRKKEGGTKLKLRRREEGEEVNDDEDENDEAEDEETPSEKEARRELRRFLKEEQKRFGEQKDQDEDFEAEKHLISSRKEQRKDLKEERRKRKGGDTVEKEKEGAASSSSDLLGHADNNNNNNYDVENDLTNAQTIHAMQEISRQSHQEHGLHINSPAKKEERRSKIDRHRPRQQQLLPPDLPLLMKVLHVSSQDPLHPSENVLSDDRKTMWRANPSSSSTLSQYNAFEKTTPSGAHNRKSINDVYHGSMPPIPPQQIIFRFEGSVTVSSLIISLGAGVLAGGSAPPSRVQVYVSDLYDIPRDGAIEKNSRRFGANSGGTQALPSKSDAVRIHSDAHEGGSTNPPDESQTESPQQKQQQRGLNARNWYPNLDAARFRLVKEVELSLYSRNKKKRAMTPSLSSDDLHSEEDDEKGDDDDHILLFRMCSRTNGTAMSKTNLVDSKNSNKGRGGEKTSLTKGVVDQDEDTTNIVVPFLKDVVFLKIVLWVEGQKELVFNDDSEDHDHDDDYESTNVSHKGRPRARPFSVSPEKGMLCVFNVQAFGKLQHVIPFPPWYGRGPPTIPSLSPLTSKALGARPLITGESLLSPLSNATASVAFSSPPLSPDGALAFTQPSRNAVKNSVSLLGNTGTRMDFFMEGRGANTPPPSMGIGFRNTNNKTSYVVGGSSGSGGFGAVLRNSDTQSPLYDRGPQQQLPPRPWSNPPPPAAFLDNQMSALSTPPYPYLSPPSLSPIKSTAANTADFKNGAFYFHNKSAANHHLPSFGNMAMLNNNSNYGTTTTTMTTKSKNTSKLMVTDGQRYLEGGNALLVLSPSLSSHLAPQQQRQAINVLLLSELYDLKEQAVWDEDIPLASRIHRRLVRIGNSVSKLAFLNQKRAASISKDSWDVAENIQFKIDKIEKELRDRSFLVSFCENEEGGENVLAEGSNGTTLHEKDAEDKSVRSGKGNKIGTAPILVKKVETVSEISETGKVIYKERDERVASQHVDNRSSTASSNATQKNDVADKDKDKDKKDTRKATKESIDNNNPPDSTPNGNKNTSNPYDDLPVGKGNSYLKGNEPSEYPAASSASPFEKKTGEIGKMGNTSRKESSVGVNPQSSDDRQKVTNVGRYISDFSPFFRGVLKETLVGREDGAEDRALMESTNPKSSSPHRTVEEDGEKAMSMIFESLIPNDPNDTFFASAIPPRETIRAGARSGGGFAKSLSSGTMMDTEQQRPAHRKQFLKSEGFFELSEKVCCDAQVDALSNPSNRIIGWENMVYFFGEDFVRFGLFSSNMKVRDSVIAALFANNNGERDTSDLLTPSPLLLRNFLDTRVAVLVDQSKNNNNNNNNRDKRTYGDDAAQEAFEKAIASYFLHNYCSVGLGLSSKSGSTIKGGVGLLESSPALVLAAIKAIQYLSSIESRSLWLAIKYEGVVQRLNTNSDGSKLTKTAATAPAKGSFISLLVNRLGDTNTRVRTAARALLINLGTFQSQSDEDESFGFASFDAIMSTLCDVFTGLVSSSVREDGQNISPQRGKNSLPTPATNTAHTLINRASPKLILGILETARDLLELWWKSAIGSRLSNLSSIQKDLSSVGDSISTMSKISLPISLAPSIFLLQLLPPATLNHRDKAIRHAALRLLATYANVNGKIALVNNEITSAFRSQIADRSEEELRSHNEILKKRAKRQILGTLTADYISLLFDDEKINDQTLSQILWCEENFNPPQKNATSSLLLRQKRDEQNRETKMKTATMPDGWDKSILPLMLGDTAVVANNSGTKASVSTSSSLSGQTMRAELHKYMRSEQSNLLACLGLSVKSASEPEDETEDDETEEDDGAATPESDMSKIAGKRGKTARKDSFELDQREEKQHGGTKLTITAGASNRRRLLLGGISSHHSTLDDAFADEPEDGLANETETLGGTKKTGDQKARGGESSPLSPKKSALNNKSSSQRGRKTDHLETDEKQEEIRYTGMIGKLNTQLNQKEQAHKTASELAVEMRNYGKKPKKTLKETLRENPDLAEAFDLNAFTSARQNQQPDSHPQHSDDGNTANAASSSDKKKELLAKKSQILGQWGDDSKPSHTKPTTQRAVPETILTLENEPPPPTRFYLNLSKLRGIVHGDPSASQIPPQEKVVEEVKKPPNSLGAMGNSSVRSVTFSSSPQSFDSKRSDLTHSPKSLLRNPDGSFKKSARLTCVDMASARPPRRHQPIPEEPGCCQFCGKFDPSFIVGKQQKGDDSSSAEALESIFYHFQNECLFLCSCPLCLLPIEIRDIHWHMAEDCDKRHNVVKQCPKCFEVVPIASYDEHIVTNTCERYDPLSHKCPLCNIKLERTDTAWAAHISSPPFCSGNPRKRLAQPLLAGNERGTVETRNIMAPPTNALSKGVALSEIEPHQAKFSSSSLKSQLVVGADESSPKSSDANRGNLKTETSQQLSQSSSFLLPQQKANLYLSKKDEMAVGATSLRLASLSLISLSSSSQNCDQKHSSHQPKKEVLQQQQLPLDFSFVNNSFAKGSYHGDLLFSSVRTNVASPTLKNNNNGEKNQNGTAATEGAHGNRTHNRHHEYESDVSEEDEESEDEEDFEEDENEEDEEDEDVDSFMEQERIEEEKRIQVLLSTMTDEERKKFEIPLDGTLNYFSPPPPPPALHTPASACKPSSEEKDLSNLEKASAANKKSIVGFTGGHHESVPFSSLYPAARAARPAETTQKSVSQKQQQATNRRNCSDNTAFARTILPSSPFPPSDAPRLSAPTRTSDNIHHNSGQGRVLLLADTMLSPPPRVVTTRAGVSSPTPDII